MITCAIKILAQMVDLARFVILHAMVTHRGCSLAKTCRLAKGLLLSRVDLAEVMPTFWRGILSSKDHWLLVLVAGSRNNLRAWVQYLWLLCIILRLGAIIKTIDVEVGKV